VVIDMRQVSITEHPNAPTTVYVDGTIYNADSHAKIGEVLVKEGVKPDTRINWMNGRGKADRVMAAQFLPAAPVKKGKRKDAL
jgi:hypothetical protein